MKKTIYILVYLSICSTCFTQSLIMDEAAKLFQTNQFKESLELLNKVIEQNPNDMTALLSRSCVLDAMNDYEDALTDIETVIKSEPFNIEAVHIRAAICENMGKHEKAIEDETIVLEKVPNYTSALNVRGMAYGNICLYNDALIDFTSAISNGIKQGNNVALYYLNRANIYFFMEDYNHALEDVDVSISLNNKDVESFILKSKIYKRKGEFQTAIAWATKAIKMKPNYYEIYYLRIVEYLELNQYKKAENDIAFIKDAMSGFSAYHAVLAFYYYKTENYLKSLEEVKISRELKSKEKELFTIRIITDEVGDILLQKIENSQF